MKVASGDSAQTRLAERKASVPPLNTVGLARAGAYRQDANGENMPNALTFLGAPTAGAALGLPPAPMRTKLFELTYDLRKPHQGYEALLAALNKANALRIQQSTWWLPSTLTAMAIRDVMLTLIDSDDSVTVVEIAGDVAGYEARPEVRAWIERYINAFVR